jgi:hypothetical protein
MEPELILDYQGVKVFRCYEDDDIAQPETFILTTNPQFTDSSGTQLFIFDIRHLRPDLSKLPEEPHGRRTTDALTLALMELIETKKLF